MANKHFTGYMQVDLENDQSRTKLTGDWVKHWQRILKKPRNYCVVILMSYVLTDKELGDLEQMQNKDLENIGSIHSIEFSIKQRCDEDGLSRLIAKSANDVLDKTTKRIENLGTGLVITWLADYSYARIKVNN